MRPLLSCCVILAFVGCVRKPEAEPVGVPNQIDDPPVEELRPPSRSGVHTSSSTHTDLPAKDRPISAAERPRLRVEWGSVKVLRERHETQLVVTGRLLLTGDDGNARPVDWPQPVRVLIATEAGKTPDWSKRHDEEDTADADDVAGFNIMYGVQGNGDKSRAIPIEPRPAGEFVATLPAAAIRRPVGSKNRFQVGLCLGKKEAKTLSWTNIEPVLPQSVTTLEITGPAKLSETLRLINACPSPIGWDWDAAALVRASNHLRLLGKEKAIAELRAFLLIARDPGYSRHGRTEPGNIDTSIQWCLATLVPLVFDGTINRNDERVMVWDGIPFHTIRIHGTSGWPPWSGPLVDSAAKDGKLIVKPLVPTNRPLEAADALFEKIATPEQHQADWPGLKEYLRTPEERKSDSPGLKEHLRWQAWRLIAHLVPPTRRDPSHYSDNQFSDDKRWAELKARAARLDIKWDEKRQEYVARKN